MFGRRLILFELFGFTVRLDASWLVLATVIAWSLAAGYFPLEIPGLPAATYWIMAAAGLIGLALSVVVHELAHAVVARRFDLRIAGITLFVFGGIAEMPEEPQTPKAEAVMALAGPAMSLTICGLLRLACAGMVAAGIAEGNPAVVVLRYLALLNLMLGAFNLIPAFPLDGGRVLRAVLWGWRGDLLWATRFATGAGAIFGLLLMACGAWNLVIGQVIEGAWWLLVGLFLRAAAAESWRRCVKSR